MTSPSLRRLLAAGATAAISLAVALPAGTAGAIVSTSLPAKPATALPAPKGAEKTVIVMMRSVDPKLSIRSAQRQAAETAAQTPLLSELRQAKATDIKPLTIVNAVVAKVASNQIAALKKNPAVKGVYPNATIHEPIPTTLSSVGATPAVASSSHLRSIGRDYTATELSNTCSSNPATPELDPEALTNINALGVVNGTDGGIDGANVKVAYMAEGIDTTNADFRRNAAYATANSPAGTEVINQYDFSGDGPSAATSGGEAFLDASSIAAQGNAVYDLNRDYLAPTSRTTPDCYIRIVGAAPGATVFGLKVFSSDYLTTESAFLQAIQFAVTKGVQVLNESFGSNGIPDTVQDVTRAADDAAVQSGVTVVVSSGDAGNTSTIGSPATDPNVISVGATTTFRAYAQASDGGITTPGVASGKYIDNNISDLSSGGYSAAGNTVDLVAPGDLNWDVCSQSRDYSDCVNEADTEPAPIGLEGGTSEAAPLTSAAAADVIEAYKVASGGTAPTPAQVKQILMSTATDISSPADQQGAGLLNVGAAIAQAKTLGAQVANPSATPTTATGMSVTPNQINVSATPNASSNETVSVTNTGSASETVDVSTRQLNASPVASPTTGSFCMQPDTTSTSTSCPQNTGVMPIWSGVKEVYQTQTFTVPATTGDSRLEFASDYQYTGQGSLLHVSLFNPDGALAGYSLPQGLADYGEIEVTDPAPGTWTAVFFTEEDGATPGGVGTSGTVDWSAATYEYTTTSYGSLTLASGATGSKIITVTNPSTAGDSSESIVLDDGTETTTVPVTIRTLVSTGASGGTFTGVLGGGNGRAGSPAQTSTYSFTVPAGQSSLDVSLALERNITASPYGVFDIVLANLIDPNGALMTSDTNSYTNPKGALQVSKAVQADVADPMAGNWTLVVQFENPVDGNALSTPFYGKIAYGSYGPSHRGNLPDSTSTGLVGGKTYLYTVPVTNAGVEPTNVFADQRTNATVSVDLPSLTTVNPLKLPDPSSGASEPIYIVPPETTSVTATLTGSVPVTFDAGYCEGDPDLSPAVPVSGSSGSEGSDTATMTFTEPEMASGCWYMSPAEEGPYYDQGATPATASADFTVKTKNFDPQVQTSTGDLWSLLAGQSGGGYAPVFLRQGQSGSIEVAITPSGAPGTVHKGVLYIEDQATSPYTFPYYTDGDVLEAIPYSYTVRAQLVQGNPKSASVASGSTYSGQLTVTGNSGPVTFRQTPSAYASDVRVSSSGAISEKSGLAAGTYPVYGTDSDAQGDAGTWRFVLTVTASHSKKKTVKQKATAKQKK